MQRESLLQIATLRKYISSLKHTHVALAKSTHKILKNHRQCLYVLHTYRKHTRKRRLKGMDVQHYAHIKQQPEHSETLKHVCHQ